MKYILNIILIFFSCCVPSYTTINSKKSEFTMHNGQHVYWTPDSFPILITFSKNESIEFKDGIKQAAHEWNLATKEHIFTVMETFPENKILLEIPEYRSISVKPKKIHPNKLGITTCNFFGKTSRVHSCHIYITTETNPENYPGIVLHELGHTLGLNHDIDIKSIMYPTYDIRRNAQIETIDAILIYLMTK